MERRLMTARFGLVSLAVILVLAGGATAVPDAGEGLPVAVPADTAADCGPPCGYIYPSIIPKFTDMKDRLGPSDLKPTANLHIVFTWDMDNEGTGLPDPLQDITLSHGVAKKPQWLDVSFEPAEHTFFLNPVQNTYEFDTQITFDIKSGVEVSEETGKRLMLLIKSTESGTFKPSFGVEVVNFEFEDDPLVSAPASQDAEGVNVPALPIMGLLAAMAVAVAARRR